ncbi:MAG: adenosylmethionine decarboxylase [Rhodospirillaceae bacterium]|nr:adenosylmethionine decarboxylase [Rhodospirillaceae bacterium]|tara:strand:+ start:2710 stop:3153 length:444 start_codon:yes stop_codon:yes gene_type:complete
MDQNPPSAEKSTTLVDPTLSEPRSKDYFKERDGEVFAGAHILVDLWGADRLDDIDYIEEGLRKAIDACDATLLHIHLHRFSTGGGISGVAVLAESHISVHTWPERGFAAFDIFMCGACVPELALPVLQKHFKPKRMTNDLVKRGLIG